MMRVIADLCLIPIGVGVSISLETDTPTPIGIKHRSAITRIITFQSYCPSIVRFVPTAGGSLRQRDRVGWPRVLPRWCSGGPAEPPEEPVALAEEGGLDRPPTSSRNTSGDLVEGRIGDLVSVNLRSSLNQIPECLQHVGIPICLLPMAPSSNSYRFLDPTATR